MSLDFAARLSAVASAGADSNDLLTDEEDERICGALQAELHTDEDDDEDDNDEDDEDTSIGQLAPSVHAARVAACAWPWPKVSAMTDMAMKRD